jgi:hypothetical protein
MTRILAILVLLPFLTAPAPAQEAPPKQDPPVQPDLETRTKDMQAEMTKIRGLEFKKAVKVGVYAKAELVDFLKREMEKETPRDEMLRYEKAYKHFGLLPKDFNLYDGVIELLGSSIAGFYHPKTKEMRLVRADGEMDAQQKLLEEAFGRSMENATLVHELCHAAQDQNFDLNTLPIEEEHNDDMVAAVKSLVEGDATIVGWKYLFDAQFALMIRMANDEYKKGEMPGEAANLPAYLRKTLTFPYGYGTEFVLKMWRDADEDWSVVNKMFDDPPSSTEQILHPEKYFKDRDNPTVVTLEGLGATVGDGWKELTHNVHGEFAIKLILDEFKVLEARPRRKAAEGWDGDRYHTFENGAKLLTVWYTVWDSEDEAKEFFIAYEAALAAKYPAATKDAADQRTIFKDESGKTLLERRGADVLVIDGGDDALLDKANAIWKSAVKKELKKVERVPAKPAEPEKGGGKKEERKDY